MCRRCRGERAGVDGGDPSPKAPLALGLFIAAAKSGTAAANGILSGLAFSAVMALDCGVFRLMTRYNFKPIQREHVKWMEPLSAVSPRKY